MTHRCRLLAPILLCDLSLTSSRHLDRLFSHSEAPFSTTRNQSRFRLLHSDYPLYFTSFESPRLNLNKRAFQDRYCLFVPCKTSQCCTVDSNTGLISRMRYSFFLFLHSRLLTKMVGIRSALAWLLDLSSFVDTSGSPKLLLLQEFPNSPLFSGCLVSLCMEVAVFRADFRPIGRKAQRRSGNSAAAIGQYIAVSSATGT